MLVADAMAKDIDSNAIYYKKQIYYHEDLGSLAQKINVQWYWAPSYEYDDRAGSSKTYYRTFM